MNLPVTWPASGRYILAVSGGADSMALLEMFATAAGEREYELVVANFDHGLRDDSAADAVFVAEAASRLGLPFETHAAHLGRASEATARSARYTWLDGIRAAHQAAGIVTAHHRDDHLETSLLNLARGAGRRGLAPMADGAVMRPLLRASRAQLRDYAAARQITWREDPTNTDLTNPRNFIRHKLLPVATLVQHDRYLELMNQLALLNKNIAQSISGIIDQHENPDANGFSFPRALIRDLSLPELSELIIATAQRLNPDIELDRRLVNELAVFAKTGRHNSRRPIREGMILVVERKRVNIYAV